jgi:cation/acetate symporter
LGVFWKRGNQQGAIAAIVVGFGTCIYYMLHTYPALGGSAAGQWFHIAPMAAGIFGVPAGLLALVVVSLLTPPPDPRATKLVDQIRAP